ncbi:MAG: pilus assembly protein [Pseudorhodoplanes sp.]|nr:pilus assembly protein [Pseudorhodoplanes sp.]
MLHNPKRALLARARRLRRKAVLRGFIRHQKGAAAVEFALVAAPFIALLFAIIETALIFFAGQALETAVADSSRLIMTGQAQTQNFDQAKFKQAVCSKVYGLFDCSGGMYVDVRTYSSFGNANPPSPINPDGTLNNSFVYQPGGPGDIVVARLLYEWPVYVSLMGMDLSNLGNNKRLIVATAAFRNEPYK